MSKKRKRKLRQEENKSNKQKRREKKRKEYRKARNRRRNEAERNPPQPSSVGNTEVAESSQMLSEPSDTPPETNEVVLDPAKLQGPMTMESEHTTAKFEGAQQKGKNLTRAIGNTEVNSEITAD